MCVDTLQVSELADYTDTVRLDYFLSVLLMSHTYKINTHSFPSTMLFVYLYNIYVKNVSFVLRIFVFTICSVWNVKCLGMVDISLNYHILIY